MLTALAVTATAAFGASTDASAVIRARVRARALTIATGETAPTPMRPAAMPPAVTLARFVAVASTDSCWPPVACPANSAVVALSMRAVGWPVSKAPRPTATVSVTTVTVFVAVAAIRDSPSAVEPSAPEPKLARVTASAWIRAFADEVLTDPRLTFVDDSRAAAVFCAPAVTTTPTDSKTLPVTSAVVAAWMSAADSSTGTWMTPPLVLPTLASAVFVDDAATFTAPPARRPPLPSSSRLTMSALPVTVGRARRSAPPMTLMPSTSTFAMAWLTTSLVMVSAPDTARCARMMPLVTASIVAVTGSALICTTPPPDFVASAVTRLSARTVITTAPLPASNTLPPSSMTASVCACEVISAIAPEVPPLIAPTSTSFTVVVTWFAEVAPSSAPTERTVSSTMARVAARMRPAGMTMLTPPSETLTVSVSTVTVCTEAAVAMRLPPAMIEPPVTSAWVRAPASISAIATVPETEMPATPTDDMSATASRCDRRPGADPAAGDHVAHAGWRSPAPGSAPR